MLIDERRICNRYLPDLTKLLVDSSLIELEKSGSENIASLFKQFGKPGLLVPKDYGGEGCSLEHLLSILRFVGSRCPSLALVMTMHHHTVASFVFNTIPVDNVKSFLHKIAAGCIVSSAFSEARNSADILRSSVEFSPCEDGGGGVISGEKKPVSMSGYSDFVLVSVYQKGNADNRGLVLIDRLKSQVSVKNFWVGEVFSACDNQCLVFEDTNVEPGCLLVPLGASVSAYKDRMLVADAEIAISSLFQLMMCASYLGVASRICEMYITSKVCTSAQRLDVLSQLESTVMSVYYLGSKVDPDNLTTGLCRAMLVTHNCVAEVNHLVSEASSQLGEKGYLNNEEALYIVLSSKCISYHPPSSSYKQSIVDLTYLNDDGR